MAFVLKTAHYIALQFEKRLQSQAPKWMILVLDILIVVISYSAVLVDDVLRHHQVLLHDILLKFPVVLLIYTMVILWKRTYASIVRLSVVYDMYRVFVVVLFSSILLTIINLLYIFATGKGLFWLGNIFYCASLVFSGQVMMRILVKKFYSYFHKTFDSQKHPILVFGTDMTAVNLSQILQEDFQRFHFPIGFITTETASIPKYIQGLPVLKLTDIDIQQVINDYGTDQVIFDRTTLKSLSPEIPLQMIDRGFRLLVSGKIREFHKNAPQHHGSMELSNLQIEDLLMRDPIKIDYNSVKQALQGSVIMVTGGCGSIGGEIVRQLCSNEVSRLVIVDQAETPMNDTLLNLSQRFPNVEVIGLLADVQNKARMEKAFQEYHPNYVYHAAAYKHVPMMEQNPIEAVITNIKGTKNMADLSVKYGVEKFVMISTDKAVNPSNVMGCSKRICEIYTQSLYYNLREQGNANTKFITTRFGNVLGSNGSVLPLFKRQIAAGGPVTVTHMDIIRYFLTIPEACSLVLEACCMGEGGEIFVFDMGEPVKIYHLAERMIKLAGLRPGIDIEIKEVGLRPGEKLYEELLTDKEQNVMTTNEKIMISKATKYDFNSITGKIDKLIALAESMADSHTIVRAMKQIVPEFKSMNSQFENLDKS